MPRLNRLDKILLSTTRSADLRETAADIAYVADGLREYKDSDIIKIWHLVRRSDKMTRNMNGGTAKISEFVRLGSARLKVATVLRLIDKEFERRYGKIIENKRG